MSYRRTKIRLLGFITFIWLSAIGLLNCADTLLTSEGNPGKPPGGTKTASATTVSLGGGLYETTVDATSYTEWAYFDFEAQDQIVVTNPATDSAWDIALQRFMIKINGGVSGNAGVNLVALNADNFSARIAAPSPFTPTVVDVTDAGDAGDACRPTTTGVLFAFLKSNAVPNGCWFSYSIGVLTPRDITYVVKTATPRYFKVKMLNYYSSTGTSAKIKFQWGEVTAP